MEETADAFARGSRGKEPGGTALQCWWAQSTLSVAVCDLQESKLQATLLLVHSTARGSVT